MNRRLLLLAPLALSACSISLLPKPPPAPRIYVLEAGQVEAVAGAPVDAVIAVSSPDGERVLLGPDLIWRTDNTIAYVAQSQWSSRAEDGLQSMLAQTMTRQHRFRASVEAGGARSDYDVRWTVTRFDVSEENGASTAVFEADVRIVEAASRRVIATQTFRGEAPVSDRSSSIAARALAQAARDACVRIGVFAAESVTEALARAAAEAAAREAQGLPAAQPTPPPVRRGRRN